MAAEGAPSYEGHRLASDLSQLGIQTTLIPDCAVFAMMARVNKVFPPSLTSDAWRWVVKVCQSSLQSHMPLAAALQILNLRQLYSPGAA